MKPDYYCKEREVFTMAFVKKTWKDRIAEFPTRRRLTKEDNTSELVTVAREEGTLSQEGDAFSAENMNDLESRIDAEFTEVNGKLDQVDSNIADTGWQSVTFNSEYQKNIGSISSISNGKITSYKQIKSVDLITTAHINVNVSSNNNLYLHPSNSSELTDTFEYRLRIHY